MLCKSNVCTPHTQHKHLSNHAAIRSYIYTLSSCEASPSLYKPSLFSSPALRSLKKVFITESARNKDKYHSSHTHSTDCCLQRWLPISPRRPSVQRGDRKDWSRLWRRRKEWSGAPRPGPPHGGPSLPSGSFYLSK